MAALSKTSKLAISVALLILIVLIALAFRGEPNSNLDPPEKRDTPAHSDTQTDTRSPDPVKAEGGANNDTAPSPDGTGPGSDNSLLSEPN